MTVIEIPQSPQASVRDAGVPDWAWDGAETWEWPGTGAAAGESRRWLGAVLRRHRVAGPDVLAVVSELVANAARHTRSGLPAGRVEVAVTVAPHLRRVVVQVHDQGAVSAPEPREASSAAESGRGLLLVHALATQVAVSGDGSGRTVSAVVPVSPERGAA